MNLLAVDREREWDVKMTSCVHPMWKREEL